jgi:hypothetical protein
VAPHFNQQTEIIPKLYLDILTKKMTKSIWHCHRTIIKTEFHVTNAITTTTNNQNKAWFSVRTPSKWAVRLQRSRVDYTHDLDAGEVADILLYCY